MLTMRQRLMRWHSAIALCLALNITLLGSAPVAAAFSFIPSFFKSKQAAPKQKGQVEDLSYGVALYEFFQQNYFQSMTEIMVAEQQQSMPNHQEFAQILMGGIQLSYGMEIEAEKTFTAVIDQHANLNNRARGWFYLGKLAYQKDQNATALTAFERVDEYLDRDLHDELVFLHEKISIDTSDSIGANGDLKAGGDLGFTARLSQQSIYRYYRDYNRIMRQVKQQPDSLASAAQSLDQLYAALGQATDIDNTDEILGLRDKVLTSLGYLYLKIGDNDAAIQRFRKVRQSGVHAGKAMVGYGWATINNEDYEAALTPWLALQSRSMAESSTHEALLAVPFIYEAVDLNQHALNAYDLALVRMNDELSALAALHSEIDRAGYLAAFATSLSKTNANQTAGREQLLSGGHWLDADASLVEPDVFSVATPDTASLSAHLGELLATAEMRTLFGQLNDIYWLNDNLSQWQQRMDTFGFMVAERSLRSQQLLSGVTESEYTNRYRQLTKQREQLAQLIALGSHSSPGDDSFDDITVLFSEAEKKSLKRIQQALVRLDTIAAQTRRVQAFANQALTESEKSQVLAALKKAPDNAQLQSRRRHLETMKAVLLWQASSNRVERLWNKQKLLNQIDTALADTAQRLTRFPALAQELVEQSEYQQRLASERERIARVQNSLALLRTAVEQKLALRLHSEITRREHRLKAYIGQVRLSKAVLLERQVGEAAL